jgi:hypothetical protein
LLGVTGLISRVGGPFAHSVGHVRRLLTRP